MVLIEQVQRSGGRGKPPKYRMRCRKCKNVSVLTGYLGALIKRDCRSCGQKRRRKAERKAEREQCP